MENEQTPTPEYQKGFNEGYLITKHLPDLADTISKAITASERSEGFKDGRNEFNLEKTVSIMPAYLKGNFRENHSHVKEKDRDDRDISFEND
ncbi:hypothetical protein [Ferruginibacter albus]|uniref:hypothetical protein n=1 Tax=Ferruginibacter albus TaxID=2875540 RepID=UPI001CC42FB0|nr:hypothetical protein [Ferruginibacter albus]UAY53181.1 hypothetical protein K9M53_05795 [Ferruginibacter albus]